MWWDYSDSRKVKTLKEALEQINEIAEALQDSQDGVMKKTAKTARKYGKELLLRCLLVQQWSLFVTNCQT